MNYGTRVCYLILVLTLPVMAACPNCDDFLPEQKDGPNGERVAFSQLMGDAAVPCSRFRGESTCTFDVNFIVENLGQSVRAQLLVEIDKDANGDKTCDDKSVFPQGGISTLMPGQQMGSLSGQLGPPVTDEVRFSLAIELRDSTDRLIAVSNRIDNLRPQFIQESQL